jgi:hypothetical protein
MLRTSGMNAASAAPKTISSTIRATGMPKISARSRSDFASSLAIWLRLASPVWARVNPAAPLLTTSSCSGAAFAIAVCWSPAMTTGIRVACPPFDTSVGSLV